jgi:4'-phosphopantetheinyl transferase
VLYPEWASAPDRLTLSTAEIHIWRASLDLSPLRLEELAQTLTSDELQRAERFRFQVDRCRFIAGRGTLRAILGRYLNTRPEHIRFRYAASGKPALDPSAGELTVNPNQPAIAQPVNRSVLEFNLSHSQALMVCAVSQSYQVGIDLEHVRSITDLEGLTQRFFSPQEHLAIQSLAADQRVRSFFQHWTCKEALLKATGEGLADLSKIEISIANQEAKLIRWAEKTDSTHQWWLHLFIPAADYISTLAVNFPHLMRPNPLQLVFWDWQNED